MAVHCQYSVVYVAQWYNVIQYGIKYDSGDNGKFRNEIQGF